MENEGKKNSLPTKMTWKKDDEEDRLIKSIICGINIFLRVIMA
jgi:hypothetical protein